MIRKIEVGWGDDSPLYKVGHSGVTNIEEGWIDIKTEYDPSTGNEIVGSIKCYNIFKEDKLFKTIESNNSLTIEYFI